MQFRKIIAFLILALTGFAGQSVAQQSSQTSAPKELTIVAHNISAAADSAAGKARADSGRVAVPGDVVEYRMVFTNIRDFGLHDVVFQDPIPSGLTMVLGSSKASREDVSTEYSIDSGKTWSAKPMIEVIEEGRKVKKAAPAEMYTNVRWRITGQVNPGASVHASFRAKVNAPEKPAKPETAKPEAAAKKSQSTPAPVKPPVRKSN